MRMCFPLIIAYLARKLPPPESLKKLQKITWIFLAIVSIEGLVTVTAILAVVALCDFDDDEDMIFYFTNIYYDKTTFWAWTTLFMVPIGMIVLQCVPKSRRSALEGYEAI